MPTDNPARRNLTVGAVIAGHFRIEHVLGRGGFGTVYQAMQLPLGRRVALKLLAEDLVGHAAGLARFRREAELAQRVLHPNVVKILDFGQTETGAPYIAFELLRGHSLAALLHATGALPLERVIRLGSQILKALMAAHALGIAHRDVKPSNVLVCDHPGESDFVKLLDFGIAKSCEPHGDTTGLTRTGVMLGTPGYMAPEQVLGGPVTPATDLYAVGLVLAEMISGRPVFERGNAMQICMAQAAPDPLALPDAVAQSPLSSVVQRATQKHPRQRYASAAEMLADVLGPASSMSLRGVVLPTSQLPSTAGHQLGGVAPALALAGLGYVAPPPMPAPQVAAPATAPARAAALAIAALGLVLACVGFAAILYWAVVQGPTPGPIASATVPPGSPVAPAPPTIATATGATPGGTPAPRAPQAAAPSQPRATSTPAPAQPASAGDTCPRAAIAQALDAQLPAARACAHAPNAPPHAGFATTIAAAFKSDDGTSFGIGMNGGFAGTAVHTCIVNAFMKAHVAPFPSPNCVVNRTYMLAE